MSERMSHKTRRHDILTAALSVAREFGYFELTRGKVAKAAGCSASLVQFHFNNSESLKAAVVGLANTLHDYHVLSQVVGTLDPGAKLVDPELVEPALKLIMEKVHAAN